MPGAIEIRAEQITVVGEQVTFVSELSLLAGGGEIVGIAGPSGCGKTSLLHALGGLAAPAAGRLLLNGSQSRFWQDAAVGLILQNLHLVPILTAHETVALPLQARRLPRAEVSERTAAALAGLGLEDHSGQLIQELSGGQRQRVAVARAAAGRHNVILADEPASALDPHWRAVVLTHLVEEARRGAIVVIASSDPELIALCNQVVQLGAPVSA